MAAAAASFSGASSETAFVTCPSGFGFVAYTGTLTAGKIVVVGCAPEATSQEFVLDTIDETRLEEITNEAGTAYSFGAPFQVGINWRIALKADASFVGSGTAIVTADPYGV